MVLRKPVPVMPVPTVGGEEKRDRFGLPAEWTILGDSAEREAAVRALIIEVFATASHHLGRDAASAAFLAACRGTVGARPGSRSPDIEALMLDIHDRWSATCTEQARRSIPRKIAQLLKGEGDWREAEFVTAGGVWLAAFEYSKGPQIETIAKRVRDLVAARGRERQAQADRTQQAARDERRHKAYLRKLGVKPGKTLLGTEK